MVRPRIYEDRLVQTSIMLEQDVLIEARLQNINISKVCREALRLKIKTDVVLKEYEEKLLIIEERKKERTKERKKALDEFLSDKISMRSVERQGDGAAIVYWVKRTGIEKEKLLDLKKGVIK